MRMYDGITILCKGDGLTHRSHPNYIAVATGSKDCHFSVLPDLDRDSKFGL